MKVVEVTTTDKKTRYYLADDTGAPVEPVLMYLKFKDNAGVRKEYPEDALHSPKTLFYFSAGNRQGL